MARGATLDLVIKAIGRIFNDGAGARQGPDFLSKRLKSGNGDFQLDRIWSCDQRTLAAAASEDLDLFDGGAIDNGAGAGKDALGQALTNRDALLLVIERLDDDSPAGGVLEVGGKGDATTWLGLLKGTDDVLKVYKGGLVLAYAPLSAAGDRMDIDDTTNHILQMAAVGQDVKYRLHLYARTA